MLKKAFFYAFYMLFSRFSLRILHFLGKIVGNIAYFLPSRSKKVTRKNIGLCFPNENRDVINNLVKDSLIESSKTLFETPRIWYLNNVGCQLNFEVKRL